MAQPLPACSRRMPADAMISCAHFGLHLLLGLSLRFISSCKRCNGIADIPRGLGLWSRFAFRCRGCLGCLGLKIDISSPLSPPGGSLRPTPTSSSRLLQKVARSGTGASGMQIRQGCWLTPEAQTMREDGRLRWLKRMVHRSCQVPRSMKHST